MEPYKLRRWRRKSSTELIAFFTCARPGRSKGSACAVPDKLVDQWVRGLPGAPPIAIVSLLGRKPDGLSEFSFYSFAGAFERPDERQRRPLFIDWLQQRHPTLIGYVNEHPTTDFKPIDPSILAATAADIETHLTSGRTVVLIDSGGETRTRKVCAHSGFIEDPRGLSL